MDYSAFKVPYLAENQIKQQADLIRNKYWDKTIPVDIEKIIEINLGLSVIPLPGLHKNFGFDAFISSDWSYVYVDNDRYFDDTHYKRVRFSLAHELGHLILHQNIYQSLQINSVEDYYRFYDSVPKDQYSYLETQANKFAGYFLVPRNILQVEFAKLKMIKSNMLIKAGLKDVDDHVLIDYMVDDLAEIFNISSHAMQICVDNLDK
ncbi:MAG: hypothetical protein UT42_C0020G0008 [Candidatus Falkowbacteria bacterium GW2011_GWA2_39_24]|uniref:IrrE N-terminal-like domain-containing protein n=1 Tax=Candidatus Falkowbacteria bacterium GW2011_GWA2_39_24 TaxID=1618634 RepID=A0A0G0QWL3_9BACT|nr:MAG: hypothetical protein UT42_C0020G0008 [Candidatus Falkowbacteria bacterium GW2011_GWA2_39_24]